MTLSVVLAVEDVLSEAVARRVLSSCGVAVAQTIGLRGCGYLRRKASSLNRTALGFPVFMLTDLDSPGRCAGDLVDSWLGAPRNPGFLFRVAVVEVESWVLAHRDAFARFAAIGLAHVPPQPDTVPNPKQLVVNLFRRCRIRALRKDIVPPPHSTASVGPA